MRSIFGAVCVVLLCTQSALAFEAIDLSGSWRFQPGDDTSFAEPGFDDSAWGERGIADHWSDGGFPDTGQIAWYRRTLALPDEGGPLQWGLRMVAVRNAYEVFANGERLGGVGALPPDPSINFDQQRVFAIPDELLDGDSVVLALRVWGGSDRAVAMTGGGPRTSGIELGDYTALVQRLDAEQIPLLVFAASFCVLGLFVTYLGLRNRELSGYGWFGLAAFDLGLWLLTQSQTKYLLDLPFLTFEKFETAVAYALPPLFIQLFWTLSGARLSWPVRVWQGCYPAATAVILLSPGLEAFYMIRPVWQASIILGWIPTFWVVFKRRAEGSEGARTLSVGMLAMFVFGTHDLLINMGLIDSIQLQPLGFLVLMASVGLTLADQFTRLRTSLEAQVNERTEALRDANERLSESNLQLEQLALEDPLTGLLNRRGFEHRAEATWQRFRRSRQPYSILIGDVDHFKSINDRFGHEQGDRLLVAVSRSIRRHTRAADLVARWGGEEFIVLLETGVPGAEIAAEQIRGAVEAMSFSVESTPVSVTLTVGVAECRADESPEDCLRRADAALYEGKQSGRNRVVCARS